MLFTITSFFKINVKMIILISLLIILHNCSVPCISYVDLNKIENQTKIELIKISNDPENRLGLDDDGLDYEIHSCINSWKIYKLRKLIFKSIEHKIKEKINRLILLEYGTSTESLSYEALLVIEKNNDYHIFKFETVKLSLVKSEMNIKYNRIDLYNNVNIINVMKEKIYKLYSSGCGNIPGHDGMNYFFTYYDYDCIFSRISYSPDIYFNYIGENERLNNLHNHWKAILQFKDFIEDHIE